VFSAIEQRRELHGITSRVAVSYVEIFGEYVSDLLRGGARCGNSKASAQVMMVVVVMMMMTSEDDICLIVAATSR